MKQRGPTRAFGGRLQGVGIRGCKIESRFGHWSHTRVKAILSAKRTGNFCPTCRRSMSKDGNGKLSCYRCDSHKSALVEVVK